MLRGIRENGGKKGPTWSMESWVTRSFQTLQLSCFLKSSSDRNVFSLCFPYSKDEIVIIMFLLIEV